MKRLLLIALFALPLLGFGANFVYDHYDNPDEAWCDEYWGYDYGYHHHNHWVYYPHGYYCVYYVWWHPWYWDWYWDRCHWCHHWDWHFFSAGYYVVWYSDGGWWWRPRYGRPVRYKLPYEYHDFRWKAQSYGVNLPEKPGREIDLPYKEQDVQRLMKERDPELFKRVEQEQKSGNLERIRQDYDTRVKKEIEVKNEEYRTTQKERTGNTFTPVREDQRRVIREENRDQGSERGQTGTERDRTIRNEEDADREPNDRDDNNVIRGGREEDDEDKDDKGNADNKNQRSNQSDQKNNTKSERDNGRDNDREGGSKTNRSNRSGR